MIDRSEHLNKLIIDGDKIKSKFRKLAAENYGIISGTNANGYYIKFPNGSMICGANDILLAYKDMITDWFGTTSGGSNRAEKAVAFPIEFTAIKGIAVSSVGYKVSGVHHALLSNSGVTLRAMYQPGGTANASYVAVGDWE